MSDYDRGKYYPKKKLYPSHRESSSNTFGSRIYSKSAASSKYNNKDGKEPSDKDEQKIKTIQQPTILLNKNRNTTERPSSPKRQSKENEAPITITATGVQETCENGATQTPSMTKSVKLLEDGVIRIENVTDFLQDSHDFLVVGVIGGQGVGKSTLLNLIAHKQLKNDLFECSNKRKRSVTNDTIKILREGVTNLLIGAEQNDAVNNDADDTIFQPQSFNKIESGDCGTKGIDVFVTSNRLILLDCQPIISAAVLADLVQSDNKRSSVAGEFLPLENVAEIQALQMTTFLMSVCHILMFVQDWFFDSNAVRFIRTAEMLKPTMPSNEEEIIDHFPHLLLIQNRATTEDFTPSRFKVMQEAYRTVFHNSKLHLESKMSLNSGRMAKELCIDCTDDLINLFLVPEYNDKEKDVYKGHPDLEELILKLQGRIHGATKYPLTHIQLTERNWLQYVVKVWDHVKKSSFFVEYTKLMP